MVTLENFVTFRSSPPRRGCFHPPKNRQRNLNVFPASAGVFPPLRSQCLRRFLVFPASAGVFLPAIRSERRARCLPRLGGGVSERDGLREIFEQSSPPRRGCFCMFRNLYLRALVFPASAGVFPTRIIKAFARSCLPRLGGGVSRISCSFISECASSPPRRGCFRDHRCPRRQCPVFPASAGVFPTPCKARFLCLRLPRLGGGVSLDDDLFVKRIQSSPPRRGCFCQVS